MGYSLFKRDVHRNGPDEYRGFPETLNHARISRADPAPESWSHEIVILAIVVSVCVVLLLAAVFTRSFELDEGYSILLLDGVPRLHWPSGLFTRADIAQWFTQDADISSIPGNLRRFDVHPPVWFMLDWCWRKVMGSSLVAARCLSLVLTLANFAVFYRIARHCGISATFSSALAFLCYATIYTGSTVRMYPLGLLFLLCGVLALLSLLRSTRRWQTVCWSAAAGLCFGLGAATHMLLLFSGAMMSAVAAVVLLRRRAFLAIAALATAPLPFLLWSASYFLVQDRRDGQFPTFHALPMLFRVVRDIAAAIVGGTPLYFDGPLRIVTGALLTLLMLASLALAVAVAIRQRRDPATCILAVGALAMPCTLYGLGALFDRQASEPRYILYSVPFLALLLAQGFRQTLLPRIVVAPLLAALLGAELVGAIGLILSPNLQQPARGAMAEIARHWQAGAVLLLPEEVDTSGMTVDYAYEARPAWPMLLLRHGETAAGLVPLVQGRPALFMILLADGVGQQAVQQARRILVAHGWHDVGSSGAHVSRLGQVWTEFVLRGTDREVAVR